jgi:hypothetical protein
MADLRTLLSELGYTGVRTYLQSGNAVFAHPGSEPVRLAEAIENSITEKLGPTISYLVRTRDEIHAEIEKSAGKIATDDSKPRRPPTTTKSLAQERSQMSVLECYASAAGSVARGRPPTVGGRSGSCESRLSWRSAGTARDTDHPCPAHHPKGRQGRRSLAIDGLISRNRHPDD